MIENKFIHDYRSHSSYEKMGLEVVKKFEDLLDIEFMLPGNKFTFYFRNTNFKEAKYFYHGVQILNYLNRMLYYFSNQVLVFIEYSEELY
jgi:hypothetical protein